MNPPRRPSLSRTLAPSSVISHLTHELRSICSLGGAGSSIRRRIYGPRNLEDGFHRDLKKDEIESVLAQIEKIYMRMDLDQKTLDSGYSCCLGLLDPAANITVNSLMSDVAAAPPDGVVGTMAQRSLAGLIAFLTCLFPYLPIAEALRYLGAANVDPLIAALLIISRRRQGDFLMHTATSTAAVETALRFAANVAEHPNPEGFVEGWRNLSAGSSLLNPDLSLPLAGNRTLRTLRLVIRDIQTPSQFLETQEWWMLAECRRKRMGPIAKELPPARAALKRMLLARIHRFYLMALASLPQHELTDRYHHSMLIGGSCYGPLDPVSNIIVNTVWYDQTFPRGKEVKLIMISTERLWHAAARSLFGLVSFLCTRYPRLTPDQALLCLLETQANLEDADPYLFGTPGRDNKKMNSFGSLQTAPSITVLEAYSAAATAASHPYPLVQKDFLGSPVSVQRLKSAKDTLFLNEGNKMSKGCLELLCTVILRCPSSVGMSHEQKEPEPTKVSKGFYTLMSKFSSMFWGQHERVSRMVATALSKFNETTESQYRLHVICGVNEFVSGPKLNNDRVRASYNPWTPHIYEHSHINFLAIHGDNPATLFFAECANHDTRAWCVPVIQRKRMNSDAGVNPEDGMNPDAAKDPEAGQVRCIYCEHHKNRIVHPTVTHFQGRNNFLELCCKPNGIYWNDKAISRGRVDSVDVVEDDAVYRDYVFDEVDDSDEYECLQLEVS